MNRVRFALFILWISWLPHITAQASDLKKGDHIDVVLSDQRKLTNVVVLSSNEESVFVRDHDSLTTFKHLDVESISINGGTTVARPMPPQPVAKAATPILGSNVPPRTPAAQKMPVTASSRSTSRPESPYTTSFTARMLIFAAVTSISALLRRLFPHRITSKTSAWSDEDLRAAYRVRKFFLGLCSIPFAVITIWGSYEMLLRIYSAVYADRLDGRFLMLPDPKLLLVPAFFVGLPLAHVATIGLSRLLLWHRYDEYVEYCNRSSRIRPVVSNWLASIIGAVGAAMAVLCMDTSARISEHGFIINPFFSFGETTVPFTDITAVLRVSRFKAAAGNIVDRPYYAVRFSNGTQWVSQDTLYSPAPGQPPAIEEKLYKEAMAFLAARAGRKIETVEFLE